MVTRAQHHQAGTPPAVNRPPSHHLDGEMLLAYAAGNLGEAASVLVATHLSWCPKCRGALAAAEAVGGALLEDLKPEPVAEQAMAAVLARLDMPEHAVPSARSSGEPAETQPVCGTAIPKPVRDYLPKDLGALRWSWVSPGVRFAALLTDETGAKMGLMRSAPGAGITPHGHTGEELTMVLSGGYRDGAAGYGPGDVQAVDENTTHEQVTDLDGDCLALVMIRGPIKPTRLIARIFRHFTPF